MDHAGRRRLLTGAITRRFWSEDRGAMDGAVCSDEDQFQEGASGTGQPCNWDTAGMTTGVRTAAKWGGLLDAHVGVGAGSLCGELCDPWVRCWDGSVGVHV